MSSSISMPKVDLAAPGIVNSPSASQSRYSVQQARSAWYLTTSGACSSATVSLFVALARAVSPGVPILGAVEVGEDEAVSALDGLVPGLEIVPRAGAPQGDRLVEWARHATVPTGPGTAYVVGHGQSIQRLRAVLLGEQHLDRHRIKSKAFWADGKRGLSLFGWLTMRVFAQHCGLRPAPGASGDGIRTGGAARDSRHLPGTCDRTGSRVTYCA